MFGIDRTMCRAMSVATVVALPSAVAIARSNPPAFVLGDVTINVAGNAKIGSVRSGMLCTPNGKLLWHQIAMPTEKAMRETVTSKMLSAGLTQVGGESRSLTLSIDGAAIKVCTAWKGMGNAPKGKGSLTLTWRASTAATPASTVTMDEELVFDRRDPRMDSSVILDAIGSSAIKYAGTFETEK